MYTLIYYRFILYLINVRSSTIFFVLTRYYCFNFKCVKITLLWLICISHLLFILKFKEYELNLLKVLTWSLKFKHNLYIVFGLEYIWRNWKGQKWKKKREESGKWGFELRKRLLLLLLLLLLFIIILFILLVTYYYYFFKWLFHYNLHIWKIDCRNKITVKKKL